MFNAKDEVKKVIAFIREYYQKNNLGGAILGISGGKDSAIVAGLMVEALGKENVIGVTMPCHSHEEDKSDAKLISDHYGFKLVNFDLTEIFDNFQKEASRMCEYDIKTANNSNINLKPRLRMATLYYLAALYTQMLGKPYLVVGTSNKSELYVGYFTKGGDSVHDIAPIADFTVSEVIIALSTAGATKTFCSFFLDLTSLRLPILSPSKSSSILSETIIFLLSKDFLFVCFFSSI